MREENRPAAKVAHADAAMPLEKASIEATRGDEAAFEMAAFDVTLSDMLSSLADHAKRGSLDDFKARFLRPADKKARPHGE